MEGVNPNSQASTSQASTSQAESPPKKRAPFRSAGLEKLLTSELAPVSTPDVTLEQRQQVSEVPSISSVNPLQATVPQLPPITAPELPPITAPQCRVALAMLGLTTEETALLTQILDLSSGITEQDIDTSSCWLPLQQKLKVFNKLLAIDDDKTPAAANAIAQYLKLGMTSFEKVKQTEDLPRGIGAILNTRLGDQYKTKVEGWTRFFNMDLVSLIYTLMHLPCLTDYGISDLCKANKWEICSQNSHISEITKALIQDRFIINPGETCSRFNFEQLLLVVNNPTITIANMQTFMQRERYQGSPDPVCLQNAKTIASLFEINDPNKAI